MSKRFYFAAGMAVLVAAVAGQARAAIQISEFCSNTGGALGEFVEITNTGTAAVDMTGWSEDDSTRTSNKSGHSLSAFGMLQPGESAIFTETDPATFKIQWWGSEAAAPAGLKIIGPYTNDNLSSSGDEVNLYDNNGLLVDRVTYNTSAVAPSGGGAASAVTRNAPADYVVNSNQNILFVNSVVGDSYGSFQAAGILNLVGNPGSYVVPEPASLGLVAGLGLLAAFRRRCAE